MSGKSIKSTLLDAVKILANAKIENPKLDARLLLLDSLNITHEELLLKDIEIIPKDKLLIFNDYILQRAIQQKPIAKIIGKKSFWKDEFITGKFTLDPRADTETIIELTIDMIPQPSEKYKFLDIGTGSGCIALSLLREFQNATMVATDISENAIKVALQNAKKLKLNNKINFICTNWADSISCKYDAIFSNPPYIPETDNIRLAKEVLYDPKNALFAGENGLESYRHILNQTKNLLKINGLLFFEIGIGQSEQIIKMAQGSNFILQEVRKDIAGIERILCFSYVSK